MRKRGKVTFYQTRNGTGLIRSNSTGEFYFLSGTEVHPSDLIIYEGLELSFNPVIDRQETIAVNVKARMKIKTGHVLNIIEKEDCGYITDEKGETYWFRPSYCILKGNRQLQLHDKVQFISAEGKNHPVCYAFEVVCDNRSAIFKFSFTRNWDSFIAALAKLAKPETWNYVNFDTEPYPLLKNYFIHTFQKVFEQERIGYYNNRETETAYACFHTGLESINNEDIYGVFAKKMKEGEDPFTPGGWKFSHFTDKWMNLLLQCNRTPLQASYRCSRGYDTFDHSLEIRTVVNTILLYKKDILPKSFFMQGYDHCAAMVTKSIEHTIELIKSGKVVPVAKYFHGNIEFTAPVYFDGKQSDMALVIKRTHEDFYFAHNLVPLDIAYKNARLLGPVDSDWLKPIYHPGTLPVHYQDVLF